MPGYVVQIVHLVLSICISVFPLILSWLISEGFSPSHFVYIWRRGEQTESVFTFSSVHFMSLHFIQIFISNSTCLIWVQHVKEMHNIRIALWILFPFTPTLWYLNEFVLIHSSSDGSCFPHTSHFLYVCLSLVIDILEIWISQICQLNWFWRNNSTKIIPSIDIVFMKGLQETIATADVVSSPRRCVKSSLPDWPLVVKSNLYYLWRVSPHGLGRHSMAIYMFRSIDGVIHVFLFHTSLLIEWSYLEKIYLLFSKRLYFLFTI